MGERNKLNYKHLILSWFDGLTTNGLNQRFPSPMVAERFKASFPNLRVFLKPLSQPSKTVE